MVTITSSPDVLMGAWVIRVDEMIVFSDASIFRALRVARRHYDF